MEPLALPPLNLNQQIFIKMVDLAMCIKGNIQFFHDYRDIQRCEVGLQLNTDAMQDLFYTLWNLKQLMPKEEYADILNRDVIAKKFDQQFLQEPIELEIKPPKKSRILLPGDQ